MAVGQPFPPPGEASPPPPPPHMLRRKLGTMGCTSASSSRDGHSWTTHLAAQGQGTGWEGQPGAGGTGSCQDIPSLPWYEGQLTVLVTQGDIRGTQGVVIEGGAAQSSPIFPHPGSSHRRGAAGRAMGQTFPYKNNISSFFFSFLISSFEIID